MTQMPEKIVGGEASTQEVLNFLTDKFNNLITYLTAREELEDTRYKELTSRIDTIAGNQLEMKRGELAKDLPTEQKVERDIFGQWSKVPVDQPKRWRAKLSEEYFYVTSAGYVQRTLECHHRDDEGHYLIGNYHQTREQATAYKARLLELGKEI